MKTRKKDPHAVIQGKRGAAARMTKMTPAERKEVAKKAAAVRWKGHKKPAGKKGK
jgi:hypothetical protein